MKTSTEEFFDRVILNSFPGEHDDNTVNSDTVEEKTPRIADVDEDNDGYNGNGHIDNKETIVL